MIKAIDMPKAWNIADKESNPLGSMPAIFGITSISTFNFTLFDPATVPKKCLRMTS